MVVMFALGPRRGQAWTSALRRRRSRWPSRPSRWRCRPSLQVDPVAWAPSTWPSRTPIVKDLPSVETLGLHLGDQLGQDRHADDEPDDGRRGGRPDRPLRDLRASATASTARSQHAAGTSDIDRGRDPAVRRRQRRQARRRQGRRRPDRGRAAGARPQGRARHRRHPGRAARASRRCRSTPPTS